MKKKVVEVGKQYVVGYVFPNAGGFTPSACNSFYCPEHPCRVTVVKAGRKFAYIMVTGKRRPMKIALDGLWEIDEAKEMYRHALELRDSRWKLEGTKRCLGKERIDQLVNNL